MYLTVHTPFSLIIGTKIKNPFVSFFVAFLSHFILDAIPHDPKWQTDSAFNFAITVIIDFILVFSLLIILNKYKKNILSSISLLSATAGGIMPDVLWGINIISPIKFYFLNQYQNFHHWVHTIFYQKMFISWPMVILIQGATFLTCLIAFLKISKSKIK